MKKGFTLIELLVTTAIASILSVALLSSYLQINTSAQFMNEHLDIANMAILIDRTLTRDLSGAFIPVQAVPTKKKETSKGKDLQKQEQKDSIEQQEEQRPLLKDPFISKNKDKHLLMLSFITNNPSRSYWSEKSGVPQPNVARVVYSLIADKTAPKGKSRFILYRQESTELNLAAYIKKDSEIERYEIARNITSCNLTLMVTEEEQQEEQQNATMNMPKENTPQVAKKTKQKKKEQKTFTDWIVGKNQEDVRSKAKLPELVMCNLIIESNGAAFTKEFNFAIPILCRFQTIPEPEKQPAQQGKPSVKPTEPKQEQERKEILASGANKIVNNIRGLFKT